MSTSTKSTKKQQLRECPSKSQKSIDLVHNQGDNDTITIPTNQNRGKYNGNFCGNSFTFVTIPVPSTSDDVIGLKATIVAPILPNDAIILLQNQLDVIKVQLDALKNKSK